LLVVAASLFYFLAVETAAGAAAGAGVLGPERGRGAGGERVGLVPLQGSTSSRGIQGRMGKDQEGKAMKKDSKKAKKLDDVVKKRRKEEEEEEEEEGEGVECEGKQEELEEEAGAERRRQKKMKKDKKDKKGKKEKEVKADEEAETVGTPLSRKAKRKERKEKRRRESEGLGEDEEEEERKSKKKRLREKYVEEEENVKEEEEEEEEEEDGDEVQDANKDRGEKKKKKKKKKKQQQSMEKQQQRGEEAQKTEKSKAAQQEPAAPTPLVVHPFKTEEADHAETPLLAYQHIEPALVYLAKKFGKTKETLKIYDPYFCTGAIVRNMAQIGFTSVHNRCEDFYQVMNEGRIPEHDVVVTNPPYSSNHVMKILT
jgi:hypothetical protein